MPEVWSATRDTKEAAALSTLGVRVKIDQAVDSQTGREFCTFYLGAGESTAIDQVSKWRRMYRERQLEEKMPSHPLVWCLVALRNRERWLDFVNQGRFVRPVRLKGGQSLLRDASTGLRGLAGEKAVVKVTELEMAVALITLGVEPIAVDGPKGQRAFYFVNHAREIPNVHELMSRYREGKLAVDDPEHPLLYVMTCLYNRVRLLEAMRSEVQMVMVRKKNSQRSALIKADASDKSWDRVQKHFGM